MTSFCRHRRLEATCPICSKQRAREAAQSAKPARPAPSRPAAGARRTGGSRRRAAGAGVRVRRLARAADDGYRSELVPGLHASADAELLADELAFAVARRDELAGPAAPGLYGVAAAGGDREEGLWLLLQAAVLGPLDAAAEDPFAEIERVRVPWAGDGLPALEDVRFGPRGVGDPARATQALAAYRVWAARAGGQGAALAGEAAWEPPRRFDRAFERLALPGLGRAQRYDFLLTAGATGLADLQPGALHLLEDPRDPTVLAAKRVFGIGDLLLVARRAGALAAAGAVPVAALDLGLVNWARRAGDPDAPRVACGSGVAPDPDVVELLRAALGLPAAEAEAEAEIA